MRKIKVKFRHEINKDVDKNRPNTEATTLPTRREELWEDGKKLKKMKENRVGWREMEGEKEITSQQRTEEVIRLLKVISQRELSALISFNQVNELMSAKHSKCTLGDGSVTACRQRDLLGTQAHQTTLTHLIKHILFSLIWTILCSFFIWLFGLITAEADTLMAVKPDLNIAGSKWEEHFSVSLTALDPVSVVSQHWSKVPKIRVCDTHRWRRLC